MNKYLVCFIILANFYNSEFSAQDYKITSFQDVYTEIDQYNSVVIEERGRLYWEKRFELDFEFPFFDKRYDYLEFEHQGVGNFDDSKDFSIFLMAFGYTYDIAKDTIDLQSDVRYKLTTRDGLKALVIQFTKNRLFSDPSVALYDSYINFQCWFFENGTIEVRFGEINLDNSPVYVKGEGFYLLTNQGPKLSGPGLKLVHPLDLSRSIGFLGQYDSFKIVNGYSLLTTLPPKGWVIKFENVLVNNKEVPSDAGVLVYPNPANNQVNITGVDPESKISVMDQMGNEVLLSEYREFLDISTLNSGIYFLQFIHLNQIITRKFIKM